MPPPSKAERKSLTEMDDLVPTDLRPTITVVTGSPGSGKTTLAASLFSPEVGKRLAMSAAELEKAKEFRLPGALWIAADTDAITALQAKKLRPQWTLELSAIKAEAGGNVGRAMRDLHAYVEEAKGLGCTGYVVDTATAFGAGLVADYVDASENGFAGWQSVGTEQLKLLRLGQEIGLRQVWLCQPIQNKLEEQALAEETSKKGNVAKAELLSAKAMAQGVAGATAYIVPALSGKMILPNLNSQCSISGWLRVSEVNGRKKRIWMPYGGEGSVGKARYEGILDKEEPADLWAQDLKIQRLTGSGA